MYDAPQIQKFLNAKRKVSYNLRNTLFTSYFVFLSCFFYLLFILSSCHIYFSVNLNTSGTVTLQHNMDFISINDHFYSEHILKDLESGCFQVLVTALQFQVVFHILLCTSFLNDYSSNKVSSFTKKQVKPIYFLVSNVGLCTM